jgi:hypothetical protein
VRGTGVLVHEAAVAERGRGRGITNSRHSFLTAVWAGVREKGAGRLDS